MTKATPFVLLLVALFAASESALAHHSEAMYDKDKLTKVTGIVTEHRLINPHQLIHMKVTDSTGKVTPWVIQGPIPAFMRDAGWTKETLKPGDQITVTGLAYRDGTPGMSWVRIEKDGSDLTLPAFKKRMLGVFLQEHGKDLPREEYEVYKKLVTTGDGAFDLKD